MPQPNIRAILSTRLEFMWPATSEERGLFGSEDKGWFYTFKLASGQSFVARFSKTNEVFTFRPLNHLLKGLRQFEWRKKISVNDLGYEVLVWTDAGVSEAEKDIYKTVLSPTPISDKYFPLTKIAFKHYDYPPMLEGAILVRNKFVEQEKIRQMLSSSEKQLTKLMIPRKESNQFIQQKINERRQKNG